MLDGQITLSNQDLQAVISLSEKLYDWVNYLWQFYAGFTGIVVGWLFTKKDAWRPTQKWVATILFSTAAGINGYAIYNTHTFLDKTLNELRLLATNLVTKSDLGDAIRTTLTRDHWYILIVLHIITDFVVIYCIWRIDIVKGLLSNSGTPNPELVQEGLPDLKV